MTRPTLTGTPDAVPTVELDELLQERRPRARSTDGSAQADVVADRGRAVASAARAARGAVPPARARIARSRSSSCSTHRSSRSCSKGLREANVRELFEDLDPDDRARLTEEMPAKVARRLLAGLSPNERRLTSTLLGYPEDSAGRLMSPEVASLRAGMTAGEALDRLRRIGRSAETIYALPVTDDHRRLVGALGLRDLVLADPDTPVGELMDTDVYSARVDADQEEVARLIREADLLALPIVDTEDRLVGIVTVDDAMEVLEEEETEDVARAGGAEPLGRPYLATSVLQIARSRVVWLLFLIVAATLTVNVLQVFEGTLNQVVTPGALHPAHHRHRRQHRSPGGHDRDPRAGGRRGALRRPRQRDPARGARRTPARQHARPAGARRRHGSLPGRDIGIVVSLTLLAVCTLAAFVGSLLPLVARRVGVDPAVMSAPFITTLVDASGLIIYFLIARAVLGL